MANMAVAYPRWWLWGLPAPIWRERVEFLQAFVKENRLKEMTSAEMWGVKTLPRFRPRPPLPGLVPYAHIHLGDKVYALNDAQWTKFSTVVLSDLKSRLNDVKTVEFDSLMELSQGVSAAGL